MVTLIKLLWNCYLELWIKGSGGNVRNVNLHLFMQEIYALKICGWKMTFKALVVTLAPCQLMWVSINFMRHLKSGKWRLFWKKILLISKNFFELVLNFHSANLRNFCKLIWIWTDETYNSTKGYNGELWTNWPI